MKAWVLAVLANAALAPAAFAGESENPCRPDVLERAAAAPAATTSACPTAARESSAEEPQTREARRRSGSRIPDAELIGPRLVL
ncbi:MAG: hypothetical protein K2P58_09550 [Hyphomonadaceae bacterium]|nr:hypothetical protein [Hyphomonadaceae bacterium]